MPVGAIAIFLIRPGAAACLCIGAAAGLGAATVDGGFALAAVAGDTGLARQVAAVVGLPRWAASTVLAVAVAWMAAAAIRRYRFPAPTPGRLALRTPLRAYAALAGVIPAQSADRGVLGGPGAGAAGVGGGLHSRPGRSLRGSRVRRLGERTSFWSAAEHWSAVCPASGPMSFGLRSK